MTEPVRLEQHYSPEDAALKLAVSTDMVYKLCRQGRLSSKRVGRRRIIAESAIVDYLEGGDMGELVQFRRVK